MVHNLLFPTYVASMVRLLCLQESMSRTHESSEIKEFTQRA